MGRGIFIALAALCLAGPALAAGGDSHGGGKKVTGSDSWIALAPLTATVARDFRVRGVLQIDAGLEIADTDLRQRAHMLQPRLRDAYAASLAQYASVYIPGMPPDAIMIGDMLQAATDRVLGEDGADLLLGMVIVH